MSKVKLGSSYRNKPLVDQYIKLGQQAMKEKDYQKARENFDKAISFGGKDVTLLDYQVRPYIELEEWHRSAMEVIKQMTGKWPGDYRGHYRQARLLAKMHLYSKAIESIKQAIKVGPTRAADERTYRALQMYRADLIEAQVKAERRIAESSQAAKAQMEAARLAARKAKINYIHRLSTDVIITIAEQGLAEHPGFVVKMAGVCKGWREILLSRGKFWSTLVLGKKRNVEKVKACLERTRGNIREIRLTENFDASMFEEIADLLEPAIDNVEQLTILRAIPGLTELWRGKFTNLRYLRLGGTVNRTDSSDLVCGLLSDENTSLSELELEGGLIQHFLGADLTSQDPSKDDEGEPLFWTTNAAAHLGSLRVLRLSRCRIYSPWTDQSELLRHLPNIEAITMDQVSWVYVDPVSYAGASEWAEWRRAKGLDVVLPKLAKYTISGDVRTLGLDGISAPALTSLDLWSSNLRGSSIVPHILSPGLKQALPNITSLDIGRSAVTLDEMLEILPKLPGLKFLNVSFCAALDNSFLEALERKDSEQDLVPNLTALSIAGNTEVSAGPLRRFVLSRTPKGIRSSASTPSSSHAATAKRGNTFRPTPAKSSPFGPSRPSRSQGKLRSKAVPDSSGGTGTGTGTEVKVDPIDPPSQTASSSSTAKASIQWLNIDYCERIEPEASDYLKDRLKVRFVSQMFGGKVDEARIRGTGRYAWDAGYEDGCAGGERGCMLRKIAGTKDSYYIHHTCNIAIPPEPTRRGWTQLDQVSSTPAGSSGSIAGF